MCYHVVVFLDGEIVKETYFEVEAFVQDRIAEYFFDSYEEYRSKGKFAFSVTYSE